MKKAETIRIALAAGGTGGHLYPGIALAEAFQQNGNADIMFIGTAYGLENKILPALPYQFKRIWIRGLRREFNLANLLFPIRLMVSLLQCAFLFVCSRPDIIIGTGGYVSGPALMIGLLFRIPTAIQEQNSTPGLVNRLLGKKVNQVHLTFEDSRKYFSGQANLFVSGNPVRNDISHADRNAASAQFGLDPDKITLLIFGGSQGAHAINQTVLRSLAIILTHDNLQILWATGEKDWHQISDKCSESRQPLRITKYLDDMAAAYGASDFVLCRAGASTLSELALCGLPAILVPYPHAAGNHQEFNARSVEKAGAAITILEKELTTETLAQAISTLYRDRSIRREMARASLNLARPNAARTITAKLLTMVNT